MSTSSFCLLLLLGIANAQFGGLGSLTGGGGGGGGGVLGGLLGGGDEVTEAPILPDPDPSYRCSGKWGDKIKSIIETRFERQSCTEHKLAAAAADVMKEWLEGLLGGTFHVLVLKRTPTWDFFLLTKGVDEDGEEVFCTTEVVDMDDNTCMVMAFKSTGGEEDGGRKRRRKLF